MCKPVVGVKYCGGCNPRFDRVAWVRRLQTACPGVRLAPAGREDAPPCAYLVVCGCSACCSDVTGLDAAGGRLVVACAEDFAAAQAFLRNLQKGI